MNEEQLKPILEDQQQKNSSIMPLPKTEEKKEFSTEQTATIKELPTWSIEPPIEIKRGN